MGATKADIVLRGGRVFMGLASGFAEAVALGAGRVIAAGNDASIESLIGEATRIVDLAGRAVVPGFNDAHQHPLMLGLAQLEINLRADEVRTLEELLRRVKARADATEPGTWIVGGRYDHFELDVKRHPFREELDAVSPRNPVYLKRTCGHMGVANSRALAAAGIGPRTTQPAGGHIEIQNGRPTGLMQERAQELVYRVIPRLPQEALVQGIEAGSRLLLGQGITSVMDAGVGLRQGLEDYDAFVAARQQGRLGLRASLALTGGPNGIQDKALERGLRTGVGDDWLRVGPVKLFTDGSAGGLTAAMSVPYKCDCDNRGIFIWSDSQLEDMVRGYHAAGLQIAIHAIGDAAIGQALGAIGAARDDAPVRGRRHRIEHCGFITPTQIATMREFGMTLAPQPVFLFEFGDLYVDVLGDDRPHRSYPMRRWLEAGLHPAASSDAPVSTSDPLVNLYAMVTRRSNRGTVLGPEECLSLPEAVHCLTWTGAHAGFAEDRKGQLVPGQFADLAVIDRDIFATPPEDLLAAKVDMTIVDGRVAHDRRGELGG
jgi:predicted amidohydrolase YtcJ